MLVTGGSCALPSFAVGVAIGLVILKRKGSISSFEKNLRRVKLWIPQLSFLYTVVDLSRHRLFRRVSTTVIRDGTKRSTGA